jgi:hypothetical protein
MKSFKFTVPTFSVLVLGTVLLFSACGKDEESTPARDKFLGTYNVSMSCSSGAYQFSMSIKESSKGSEIILIEGLFNSVILEATVSDDAFNVNQTITIPNSGIFTVNGSGVITSSGQNLTFNFTLGDVNGGTDNCTANCTKI